MDKWYSPDPMHHDSIMIFAPMFAWFLITFAAFVFCAKAIGFCGPLAIVATLSASMVAPVLVYKSRRITDFLMSTGLISIVSVLGIGISVFACLVLLPC